MVRVGINGFGRIGRLALRAASCRPDFSVVHINEVAGDTETAAHLLEFDSVHGRWPVPISAEADAILVCDQRVGFSNRETPGEVDWAASAVDIVIESSGKFRDFDSLKPYFACNVLKVVVAAPVKGRALNIVMGVNDHRYDAREHDVVTAASCTTNCLAPIVKIVHERIGIRHGVITTVHDATNTQTIVDRAHKDLRRARSALTSLIPTTTGSASAIGLIYPELAGRLNGIAVRVPLLNASLTDCVFEVARATTVEEVNSLLNDAASGSLKGILGFEARPLVSVDFVNNPCSAIVDGPSTMVIDGTQVKILAWYDNEWGYANRLIELTAKVAASLPQRSAGAATILANS